MNQKSWNITVLFFQEGRLEFLRRYRPEITCVDYKNIDGFIGAIVESGKATLHELKTIYSLEDAFDMWEIIIVNRYNEYLAVENQKKHMR